MGSDAASGEREIGKSADMVIRVNKVNSTVGPKTISEVPNAK